MAQHWRPGAENFFDRIKKAQILGILGQFDAEIALRYATAKKGELATAAARLCAGDTIIEPEIKAKALAWVPDVMRFDAVPSLAAGTEVLDAAASDEADDRLPDVEEAALEAANQNDAGASTAEAA